MKALLMVCLSLLLCFACSNAANRPQNNINNTKKIPMYTNATYQVGNPNFEGRTTVKIIDKNRVTVSFEQGNKTKNFEGELSDQESNDFWNQLTVTAPCKFDSGRPGLPGEGLANFTLSSDKTSCESKVWINDQSKNEKVKSAIQLFENLAKNISKGEVTY